MKRYTRLKLTQFNLFDAQYGSKEIAFATCLEWKLSNDLKNQIWLSRWMARSDKENNTISATLFSFRFLSFFSFFNVQFYLGEFSQKKNECQLNVWTCGCEFLISFSRGTFCILNNFFDSNWVEFVSKNYDGSSKLATNRKNQSEILLRSMSHRSSPCGHGWKELRKFPSRLETHKSSQDRILYCFSYMSISQLCPIAHVPTQHSSLAWSN